MTTQTIQLELGWLSFYEFVALWITSPGKLERSS